jgi:GNAT superfamily N-acetyltransferase
MLFSEISNTRLTEAFDNPYPFNLKGPDESQSFLATANTPNGPLRMEFSSTDFDDFGIDFSIGKSMGKTDAGDEFRVFATVVAMMKKWISTVGIEHVEGFDFGANKDEHASDGRAKLYTRFAKQLASQLGWKLEQSTTGNGSTAFFRLTNPKPVPRDDEYWDALEEAVEVSLHGDAKKGYTLSKIEVSGDERNAGQGTKAMQDIVDRMDREGAIIALTPDDAFGGNKNRLIKFYKRFGFVPNKGRNKDFRFRETMIRYPQNNESVNEGYKLQLERDTDMMVLNITDTTTGKRTEVRGKAGYESGNYDANDKLHQLLDRIGKASNISELMNGEVVGINPKHPDGKNAKAHADIAFNEAAGVGRVVKGVNTTVDVGPNEIIKQVKKFGNDVDRDGRPSKHLK